MTPELKELFFAYLHGYSDASFERMLDKPEPLLPMHFARTRFFRRYVKEWDEKIGQDWLREWLVERNKK